VAVIERGLFAKAKGKKILFFNQIEDETALAKTREIVNLLPSAFCSNLSGIIADCVHQNHVNDFLSACLLDIFKKRQDNEPCFQ
jgi:hypothetical protein